MAKKTNPLVIVVGLAAFVVAAGGGYYLTRSDEEKKSIIDVAERAKLMAEVEVTKQRIAVYKAYVKACEAAKSGVKAEPPTYEGYDAFSYNDEGKYRTELGAQEARLGDLNGRLGSAFNK